MRRALLVIFCVVLFLGTGLGLSLLRQAQRSHAAEKALVTPPPAVTLLRLEKRRIAIRESFYGLIEPWEQVDLGLRRGGQVAVIGKRKGRQSQEYEYKIEEESRVKRGQQILRLDDAQERAGLASADARVEQAKATVLSAKSTVSRAKAVIEAARAGVAEAEAEQQRAVDEFERVSKLHAADRASITEMDRITADRRRADARMRIAQAKFREVSANLEAAEADLATAEASLLEAGAVRDARAADLADMVLVAPLDGVISDLPIEEGEIVAAGQMVAVLMDVARVKLVTGVVERKVSVLRLNSPVDVFVESLGRRGFQGDPPRKFSGSVSRISVAADEQTGLFTAEIKLDNEDGLLRAGMVGRAEIVVDEVDAFPVPVEAAVNHDGAWTLFFAEHTTGSVVRAVQMPMPVGPETEEFRLVENLPDNRRELIYEGQSRLKAGDEIQVLGHTTLERREDYQGRLKVYGSKTSPSETNPQSVGNDGA